jgi:hypothetical protein
MDCLPEISSASQDEFASRLPRAWAAMAANLVHPALNPADGSTLPNLREVFAIKLMETAVNRGYLPS